MLLATRDLTKAEKIKIKRNDRVYEFYFFDFVKNPDFGLFSGTELLFFLNANFIFPLKNLLLVLILDLEMILSLAIKVFIRE